MTLDGVYSLLYGVLSLQVPSLPLSAPTTTLTGLSVPGEAILTGVLCLGFPLVCLLWTRKVAKFYSARDQNQIISTVLTLLLPAVGSVITTYADVFKGATWKTPGENILLPVGATAALIGFVIVLKVYENAAKVFLSGDLKLIKAQREAAVYTNQLFTGIVGHKLSRIYVAQSDNNGKLTPVQFAEKLDPRAQLLFLFKAAHSHLTRTLPSENRLRLGLYRKSEDGSELERLFGWDGEKETCYTGQCRRYMRLDRPKAKSELVRAYFGGDDLVIHESCYTSMKAGKFEMLADDHRKKLKSMMLYRHELPHEHSKNGAMILELDTDCDNFFKEDDLETYKAFLVAFMTRVEYEYVAFDVTEAFAQDTTTRAGMIPASNKPVTSSVRPARKGRTNTK